MLDCRLMSLVSLSFAFVVSLFFSGCVAPTTLEMADVQRGQASVLLVRVAPRIDGKPSQFAKSGIEIGVGTFATGGEPQRVYASGLLSREARSQGWTSIIVPRNIAYLTFMPAVNTKKQWMEAPRWRVDLPSSAGIVYAGTFVVDGSRNYLSFGGERIRRFQSTGVRDERGAAEVVARQYLQDAGSLQTMIMRPHFGPIVF